MSKAISIIISTYNSSKSLNLVLKSYCRQKEKNFEVIIADDGSTDETALVIQNFKNYLAIKHVWHEDKGFRKCTILNKAALEATGDYLIFTDGDCLAPPNFVYEHKNNMREGFYLSGGYYKLNRITTEQIGPEQVENGEAFNLAFLHKLGQPKSRKDLLLWSKNWRLNALCNVLIPTKATFNGNNSSVYKADLMAVKGFNELMGYGGEDREFGYRLKNLGIKSKRIRYTNAAVHLEHSRQYVSSQIQIQNKRIIEKTKACRIVVTENGLL